MLINFSNFINYCIFCRCRLARYYNLLFNLQFKSGFTECAAEVARYLNTLDGVDKGVRQRILQHMGTCLTGLNNYLSPIAFPALTNGYPPSPYYPPQIIVNEQLRAVPGGGMPPVGRPAPSIQVQHFFPPGGLSPADYESPSCRSPSSPFSSSFRTGTSTPATPTSPSSSVCSKMSDSDPVWRPW